MSSNTFELGSDFGRFIVSNVALPIDMSVGQGSLVRLIQTSSAIAATLPPETGSLVQHSSQIAKSIHVDGPQYPNARSEVAYRVQQSRSGAVGRRWYAIRHGRRAEKRKWRRKQGGQEAPAMVNTRSCGLRSARNEIIDMRAFLRASVLELHVAGKERASQQPHRIESPAIASSATRPHLKGWAQRSCVRCVASPVHTGNNVGPGDSAPS